MVSWKGFDKRFDKSAEDMGWPAMRCVEDPLRVIGDARSVCELLFEENGL